MIDASQIVRSLGGKWRGRRGTVCCPAHEDRTPSLSVSETRDGRPLVHCFGGCTQVRVIDALRARGLWDGEAKVDPSYPGYLTRPHDGHRDRDARRGHEYARELWDKSNRITGTLAAEYLSRRGIRAVNWPDALGYLPLLRHTPTGKSFPALIAAVTDTSGRLITVQRTWLAKDGSGKAPIQPAKMHASSPGNGAVQLAPAQPILGIAEGVETALSAKQLYQIPVWATLSANRLGVIELPPIVESIVIFADHGKVGMEEAIKAAEVYEAQGKTVDVMPPRVHFGEQHSDFNDCVRVHT